MESNELKDKKILILGFGREGQDTFKFLRKLFPKKVLGIADMTEVKPLSSDKNIKWHLGKSYLSSIKDYDVIIKTPGIPFKILPESSLDKIITQTDIFFDNCPGTIIGVTGTKGKSTTASFIYQTLKKAGLKAHLIGNIGQPVLSFLNEAEPQSIFVYELSAHQLYNLKKSPKIAILLNIYPEHLDYYRNFKEYAGAKSNIAKFQTKNDYLIYNSQDKEVGKIAKTSKAKKAPIKGKYYELDIAAAKAVAKIFKVPELKKFEFLPHRLEYVGKFKGIEFYNDSLSTIPETTIEALDFLGNEVQTLILGGFDRGLSFDGLAKRLLKSDIKTLILFPTTGARIIKAIENFQFPISNFQYFFVKNMATAVKLAYQHTGKDKICLMSPASPSFGIFKDYAERGNIFKKMVEKYHD
ncbi:MAG: Mur ligase family protein [Candidatus Nealsonbacteria bacterium]